LVEHIIRNDGVTGSSPVSGTSLSAALFAGFFLAFWATPVMSYGHLLLALGMSAYMLVAIGYEERDLVGLFGKDYEDYRQRVGKLTPRFR
jgi:methanethiol S-methyltransferase